jgi:sugar transferase EpsL
MMLRPQQTAKRILDIAGACLGLAAGSPALLTAAVFIRATMGAPILFRQERPGKNGKSFTLYKFRTMSDARGPDGQLLSDEARLTAFGRLLRASSVDELPQLLNVLRGDMSLVGPRPLLTRYLDRYTPEQARRHEVKPGITGLAQVRGRNSLSWEEKFAYDVEYVDEWSLWLDLRILFETAVHVVKREGISAGGHATMPEFMGSRRS